MLHSVPIDPALRQAILALQELRGGSSPQAQVWGIAQGACLYICAASKANTFIG